MSKTSARAIKKGGRTYSISAFGNGGVQNVEDVLAVEEPLEIRIVGSNGDEAEAFPIAITMRTPGHDGDLAMGFLFSEGVISDPRHVADMTRPPDGRGIPNCNVICVRLAQGVQFDAERLSRHVYTSSSCGICGKQTLEQIRNQGMTSVVSNTRLAVATLLDLPQRLRASQALFESTGGLHAAALFRPNGDLEVLREDVGRHNALDKLIGALLRDFEMTDRDWVLLLSGRASFELVQKTVAAGLPIVAAVSAPSSLAVDLAREFDVSLVGFLRPQRFNIYAGSERLLN